MTWKQFLQVCCQWVLVVGLVYVFFKTVKQDFEGKLVGQEPEGFSGFLSTCIGTVMIGSLLYVAGAFDHLFGF